VDPRIPRAAEQRWSSGAWSVGETQGNGSGSERSASVAIGDGPGAIGGGVGCLIGSLSVCLEDLLPTLCLSVHLCSVVCHHAGDQFVVSHLGLFHALSIGGPQLNQ